MKKLIALTASMIMIATISFANDGAAPKDQRISENFNKHFAVAESVNWTYNQQFATANFIMNGQSMAAHFAPDAKMLGVSRNITTNELPMNLIRNLKQQLKNSWVTDVFEYATPDSDAYYVTIENADSKIILKSSDGQFYTYKKTAKQG